MESPNGNPVTATVSGHKSVKIRADHLIPILKFVVWGTHETLDRTVRMQKKAPTNVPLLSAIATRWSPRAFDARSIPVADREGCLEAARWAPSSMNDQPWFFVWVDRDDTKAFEAALECLVPFNQDWAKRAGALCFGLVRPLFAYNQEPNPHAEYDLGQSVAQLALEATHRGLFVHQMGGFEPARVEARFVLPEGFRPHVALAIGYFGDIATLPEPLQERENAARQRKRNDELWNPGTLSE